MRTLIVFVFLIMLTLKGSGQYINVKVSDQADPNETSVAIDPHNPQRIIAGANLNSVYFSGDSGKSWTRKNMTSTFGVWGDPCMAVDTAGSLYFFHLSNVAGGWIDRIVCQRSDDNGTSWTGGAGIGLNSPKNQDKEWVAINPATNEIYVTWTEFDKYGSSDTAKKSNIMFSKSGDKGTTWSPAMKINEVSGDCEDSDNTVEGAVPAVGPQGEIYVAWAGPLGLVFDRSTDGGATWLDHDIIVCDIPGGWDYMVPGIYRCNGLPVTCCDLSSTAYKGNIYINWTDQRNGTGDTDVWLVKSTDGGGTWSLPKRVNDDQPGKQQFFTWMTVDQVTGWLWFVFYDRRNYNDNRTDVWMAVSQNGGETFKNFKVSDSPFTPNANVFFGDYTGISAYNHVVRPIWTRLDNTTLSAWTALVDTLNTTALQPEFNSSDQAEPAYPNPFNESTAFSFKLRKPTRITLNIYDIFGHKIASIYDNQLLEPGKYIREFRPATYGLASGVYYFKLRGNGINRQQKIIYQK